MDQLARYCSMSSMDAAERREQFIKYYFIQNNINEKNEADYASSGLWVLTDPVVAERWYKETEEERRSKSYYFLIFICVSEL